MGTFFAGLVIGAVAAMFAVHLGWLKIEKAEDDKTPKP